MKTADDWELVANQLVVEHSIRSAMYSKGVCSVVEIDADYHGTVGDYMVMPLVKDIGKFEKYDPPENATDFLKQAQQLMDVAIEFRVDLIKAGAWDVDHWALTKSTSIFLKMFKNVCF